MYQQRIFYVNYLEQELFTPSQYISLHHKHCVPSAYIIPVL